MLKLDPSNTTLLAQKHNLLQKEIEETKNKLNVLKQASEQAAKTVGNYDAWKKAYTPIQEEIVKTNKRLDELKKKQKSSEKIGKINTQEYDKYQKEIENTEKKLESLVVKKEKVEKSNNINVEQYKKLQKEIEETIYSLDGLKEKQKDVYNEGIYNSADYKLFSDEIAETQIKLKELNAQKKRVDDEFGNPISTTQYDALQREIIETEQELKKLKETAGSSSAAMEKISNSTGKFGEKAKSAGQKMMPVTGAIVGVGAASVAAANNFEDAMSQAAGALDKPMAQMGELRELAIQTGQDTMFSAKEAGEAITELAKGGLTEADIKGGALAATMNLAASSGMSLGDAANTVVQTMGAFGLSAEETSEAVNALAGAADSSSADVGQLTQGLSQVSAQAHNAGWSVQETTAVLGRFADSNIRGSDAGTSLKTMLQRLAAPTDDAAGKIEALGLEVRDSNGHMKGAMDIAEELQTKLGGLSEAERDAALQTIFGSDASRAASVMMQSGSEGLERYIKATNDQEAAQRSANARMGDGSRAIDELKGSIETAGIKIGDTLAPIITNLAKIITELVNKFTALPGGVQVAIIAIAGIVAVIGPVLMVVGQLALGISSVTLAFSKLSGVGGVINKFVTFVSGALKGLFGLIMAHPVIAVITAIVAAIIVLYTKCEWFRDGVNAILSSITGFVESAFENVQNFFTVTIPKMIENVRDGFQRMVDGIREKCSRVGDTVREGFEDAISFITSLPSKALEWGHDFIEGLKQGIKDRIDGVVESVKGLAGKISSFLHFSRPDEGPLRNYETWMPDMMQGLANGIYRNMPVLERAVNSIAKTMSNDMSLNPKFAYASSQAVNVNNEVTVMVGNEQFKGYIVKTASKGINDMQKRYASSKGGI